MYGRKGGAKSFARMKVLSIFVYLITISVVCSAGDPEVQQPLENPQVLTTLGSVLGSLMTTRLGKNIFAFRGIRYAEAPIGQLRFKTAVPAKPWEGVFNATEEGPSCPRPYGFQNNDDCLRLNVYTKKLDHNGADKSPVIVFFHPGGFYGFSGQSYLFGPEYLLDEDVVLVTVNYRLAAIGFTSMGDELAPGNLGLKDQVEALHWIQRNIHLFNGDPDCVTISGYSAGSWSTELHMMSQMSTGLFHRVIAMSGSPVTGEPLPYHQRDLVKKQAELVGCPTNTTKAILECFESVPQEKMADTLSKFVEWNYSPILIWSPVVEPNLPGVKRFLTDQPQDLIRRGEFKKVPIIVGGTKDEFGGMATIPVVAARKGNNSIFDDLNENWDRIAPIAFQYERNSTKSKSISDQLREFYFKNETIGLDNWQSLAHLYTDTIELFPINRIVGLLSDNSDQPVYYYHFVYQGQYSFAVWPDTKKPIGVAHHDDLMYLFYMKRFFPYFDSDAPEIPTVERMTAMWANFAKTGDPIPKNNHQFENITWEPYTSENKKYMEINSTLTMKTNLNTKRMAALDRIFPLPPLGKS